MAASQAAHEGSIPFSRSNLKGPSLEKEKGLCISRAPMKHSRRFLEQKYDSLYKSATAVLEKHDPCQIQKGQCYSMRTAPENHKNAPFCCTGCVYLKADGCSVESLFCKLWVCDPLHAANKTKEHGLVKKSKLLVELAALRKSAVKYNLHLFRGSKEDNVAKALRART